MRRENSASGNNSSICCSERKCYHFDRGDILLSENLTFHWSTQATELPTARNFHNFLRPKCVIKLCVAIVCGYMETTFSAIVCDLRFAIRDRLRSFAIIWNFNPDGTVVSDSRLDQSLQFLHDESYLLH